MIFRFFNTESHGYLVVQKKVLKSLGFKTTDFSDYSPLTKNHILLEEDSDASKFIKQVKKLNGFIHIENHFINNKVFDKDRIILSNLRSAPIIGLAAKSFFYNVSPR